MIITLTGKIGSGKDTVRSLLNVPSDFTVIDADKLGHELLEEKKIVEKIKEIFPQTVIDGKISRKALAKAVFPRKIRILNNIIHPLLIEKIRQQVTSKTIIHAALLKELKLRKTSNIVIFVDTRLDMVLKRLGVKWSKKQILQRWKAQVSTVWYRKHADIIIKNNSSLEELKKEIIKKCQTLF